MLTSPMLQNSPNNIPSSAVKNTAHTANGGEDTRIASFGKALAQEMNAKDDAPETHSANGNANASNIPEDTDATAKDSKNMTNAKDSKESEGSQELKELKELKDLKDLKGRAINSPEIHELRETKIDMAAAPPQLMGLAGILHGLIAAYRSEVRTDTRTEARPQAQADTAAEALAARTLTDTQTDLATAAAQQAGQQVGLMVIQPGLAAAHLVKDGRTGASEAAAAAADTSDPMPGNPGIMAATSTPSARAKHASDIQDIRNRTAITLELGAGRGDPQQMEFGVSTPDQSINTEGLGKSLLELASGAPKDLPTTDLLATGSPNTLVPLVAVPAERGVAPAAGTFVHTAPGLEPRVGATGWDNALGQKVLWMVSNQQQVAELSLNPPDLGPLQVVLSLTNDQASATFVSQNADVRQALEAALPRLKEMMADSGISLGETTVSADTSQRQGGFEQQDRSATRHGGNRETMAAPNVKSTDIGTSRISAGGNRLVDTFA